MPTGSTHRCHAVACFPDYIAFKPFVSLILPSSVHQFIGAQLKTCLGCRSLVSENYTDGALSLALHIFEFQCRDKFFVKNKKGD